MLRNKKQDERKKKGIDEQKIVGTKDKGKHTEKMAPSKYSYIPVDKIALMKKEIM